MVQDEVLVGKLWVIQWTLYIEENLGLVEDEG